MKRTIVLAATVVLALPSSALAIVHATTPIVCAGAVAHSDGNAGGREAAAEVRASPAPGPPMPAQGLENSAEYTCG